MSSMLANRPRPPDLNSFAIFQDIDGDNRRLSQSTPTKRPSSSSATDTFKQPRIPSTVRERIPKTSNVPSARRNSLPAALPGRIHLKAHPQSHRTVSPVRQSTSSARRNSVQVKTFSLWNYLQAELAATDSDEAHDFKRERVKNFLLLPQALERTLWFGFVVCLDSFLYIFTILPVRFCRSFLNLCGRILRLRMSLKSSEKVDLFKGALILITCMLLSQLDASRIYHNIRGQAAIKLYVLYNVLEIGDKLFCALGQDILDCLFSKSTFGKKEDGSQRHLRPLAFFVLALIYNVLHTVLLLYQVVTLNVTVNSFSNALMTLLLSNQFVEIKGSVFKKFEKEGLFQITCADMVERFQLFIMLLIIGLRNTSEVGFSTALGASITTLGPMITVLGSEILVDWLKHAFITKFNHVRPTIYSRFTDVLCRDYVKSASTKNNTFVDQSPAISRRIGLPVLPLVCLTIRSSSQILTMLSEKDEEIDSFRTWESSALRVTSYVLVAALIMAIVIIFKLCLGVSIIRFAHSRYNDMQAREESEQQLEAERKRTNVYKGIVEVDVDTKRTINDVRDNLQGTEKLGLLQLERYSMVSKRIW